MEYMEDPSISQNLNDRVDDLDDCINSLAMPLFPPRRVVFRVERGYVPLPIALDVDMSEEPSKPLGRRAIIKGNNPLISFVKKGVPPKHEYYQVMMIRALKKAIRSSFSDRKLPSGGIFKSLKMTPEAIQKWAAFNEAVMDDPTLETFAATVTGPATDGKSKRTQEENTEFSSFNKKYIQKFFSHQEVRTVHYYFIEWVFQASPEQLCGAMKFKCCTRAMHTEACKQKWSGLKRYTQEGMIEEVGWTPYLQQ